ncbi:MAG: S-layer protein domain-containing protein [Candidatus Methanoperedens sp.]|nr:S-layer protein domain-containing protein [Candidatus Methanoperedens sp.]
MVNRKYVSVIAFLVFVILGTTMSGMAAPASITGLNNVTYAQTYIKWTWNDPADSNFSSVIVYIDGIWKENVSKGQENYNLTNLTADTSYTISTHTKDTNGSINATWKNDTARTAPLNETTPTAPAFTSGPTDGNITDNSAEITFSVNQSNSASRVKYSTNSTLSSGNQWSEWKNSSLSRKITLSDLAKNTTYYYSVYAYNESNQSLSINSSIDHFTTLDPTAPNITGVTNDTATTSKVNITFTLNQSDAYAWVEYGKTIAMDEVPKGNNSSSLPRTISITGLDSATKYYYKVYARNKINQTLESNSTTLNFTTKPPGPTITRNSPSSVTITAGEPANLSVKIGNQNGNLSWYEDNKTTALDSYPVNPNDTKNYTFTKSSTGTFKITAKITNLNGSDTTEFTIKNIAATYNKGNRIWDGDRYPDDFSTTYTWNYQSFSGFYYDPKDGIGSEKIRMESIPRSHGTISKNNIIYTTEPQLVYFNHKDWGKYQVIGFMADKYFAGYKNHTIPEAVDTFDDVSAIAQGQLHKVLYDDDTKKTISVGGTLALKDGYVLKATDIDLNGRTMFLVLLKDGTEVDSNMLRGGETYVYKKRVGGVEDLPLILVRFDGVFAGTELQAAFLKGIFQISEDVTQVKSGNKFGVMEVTEVNKDKIVMKNNDNDVGLNKGSIVDLMGDLKIIVADNNDLRFALSVDRKGSFEVRSTVFDAVDNNITEWTPYNFGMNIGKTIIGFYYNLDDGLGNEKLSMTERDGKSIPENKLVYTTEPEQVLFTHDEWGRYQVIGFMADKYFAGYKGHVNSGMVDSFDDTSAMAQGQLHKILIDDDTKRTISVGGTLALKDGYVLKATDIDLRGRTMFLVLLKDGAEVDSNMLQGGETYVYKKRVGNVDGLPLILVRFDNVFAGTELQAAFIKGIFQISETARQVKNGDQIGKMEVTSVNNQQIQMKNSGDIGLDRNKNDVLMGNIRLKTADSDTLRFYFAVDVTEDMIENQLSINVPQKAMAGDNIIIKVTAGGKAAENASLTLDTDIGTTDVNGSLNYSIPKTLKNGTYTITATKTGYEKATKNIEIEKYVDYRLSIEAPSNANQYETIQIKVLYNGTAMSGASVKFDNTSIGSTDSNGEVSYRLETSGTHSITASKQSYIMVSRDIDIRAPYSEFKALDINITPNPVFTGEDFVVKSNISNIGTKSDTLPVELIINGTAVENRSVTLAAGEKVEINFTRNEAIAANITVDVLGQSNLLIVQQKPINYLLIAAIATGIGAVIIYVLTSKGLLSLELLKQKFGLLSEKFSLLFKK